MEKERKLQILRAALKRFIKHGIKKTTLDEIARDLRIGKATLYHYFESKEDLYYQTLTYEISQYISEVQSIFNSELNFKQKLSDYFLLKENLYSKYKLIYELLIHIITERDILNEKQILHKLFKDEEDFLKIMFKEAAGKKNGTGEQFAVFITSQSWKSVFNKILLAEETSSAEEKEILINVVYSGST